MSILKYLRFGTIAVLVGWSVCGMSSANAQALPDVVKAPAGLNLGGSSFFDAVGPTDPAFIIIENGEKQSLNKITNAAGQSNSQFNNPSIDIVSSVPLLVYVSPLKLGEGAFGYTALFPFVAMSSSFNSPGLNLRNNGAGFGDITTGPFYQGAPVIRDGRPVFFYRAEFDVIVPVGKFSRDIDLNQGAGFASLNPYIALTALPTPDLEFSARFNYLYNYQTSRIANPPSVPGLIYRNGQAGSLGWVNFTASYQVFKDVFFGLNGYYLKQFANDKLNGTSIGATRQEMLYLGPGVHFNLNTTNFLNLNLYLPIETKNTAQGTQLNFRFVHVVNFPG